MRYEKNTTMLVLRVNDYGSINFIEEHRKECSKTGSVWMLKIGRALAEKSINRVMESGGCLLLKEPKKDGGKYYFCKISDIQQGKAKEEYNYPDYYSQFNPYGMPLDGTWLKISGIVPLAETILPQFELVKGGKKMTEIVNSTRSPILFVQSSISLEEKNGEMWEAK